MKVIEEVLYDVFQCLVVWEETGDLEAVEDALGILYALIGDPHDLERRE
jgi:hypothetical protein